MDDAPRPSTDGVVALAGLIAARKGEWDGELLIEREVHGTDDPLEIAERVVAWCHSSLHAEVRDAFFYTATVGATYGLVLGDGRRIAVKAHRQRVTRSFLQEVRSVQARLHREGFPCPAPIAGPEPLGKGHGTVDDWLAPPPPHDGHDPSSIRAIARCLADLLDLTMRLGLRTSIGGWMLEPSSDGGLWPEPHSDLFDLSADIEGAGQIEALARAAVDRIRDVPTRPNILGHTDLSPQNARFDARAGQVTAVYDWDAIAMRPEAFFVGSAAHSCTADWMSEDVARSRAPSLEEARTFVARYEEARGARYSPDERSAVAAHYAYATAYTARLGDHIDPAFGDLASGAGALIARHGSALLDL